MTRALLAAFAFVLILSFPLQAQESVQADESAPTDVSRLDLERENASHRVNLGMRGKPFRKMLPAGFRYVVDAEQREKVYKMQEDYHRAIQRLHARIDALEKERDREFMAVLTPEQKEKVERATPATERQPVQRRTSRRGQGSTASESDDTE